MLKTNGETALEQKKKKLGLALIYLRTTGPRCFQNLQNQKETIEKNNANSHHSTLLILKTQAHLQGISETVREGTEIIIPL